MSRLVVADSACLIALEQIGELQLLAKLFDEVIIPPAVECEFGVAKPWLKVITPANQTAVDSLKLLVDEGEAEPIALAVEHSLPVVLDDKAARRVAQKLGLIMLGTIGCILKAKTNGAITLVRPVIEKLDAAGFYLSAELKAKALELAGE